jgi:hypothetical protein
MQASPSGQEVTHEWCQPVPKAGCSRANARIPEERGGHPRRHASVGGLIGSMRALLNTVPVTVIMTGAVVTAVVLVFVSVWFVRRVVPSTRDGFHAEISAPSSASSPLSSVSSSRRDHHRVPELPRCELERQPGSRRALLDRPRRRRLPRSPAVATSVAPSAHTSTQWSTTNGPGCRTGTTAT